MNPLVKNQAFKERGFFLKNKCSAILVPRVFEVTSSGSFCVPVTFSSGIPVVLRDLCGIL